MALASNMHETVAVKQNLIQTAVQFSDGEYIVPVLRSGY